MQPSKIKDKILKALVKDECHADNESIANHLGQKDYTVYTLLKEMEKEGHIELVNKTSVTPSMSCLVKRIRPEGKHFFDTKTYRRQAIKQWWIDAPKNFWVIGAFLGLLSTNAALILSLVPKDKLATQQQMPPVSTAAKSDTTGQR
jgi:hypothetical protein